MTIELYTTQQQQQQQQQQQSLRSRDITYYQLRVSTPVKGGWGVEKHNPKYPFHPRTPAR